VDGPSNKKIGKYEITGILGRGGMGVVYRAEDKRIGRKVAIKTLTEGYSGQADMLERFYREAQAGILQHPNIVIVHDLGDENGVPFIVMEFVNGEPLDKIIASGRPIPLIDKLNIIEQVCTGLGYAHQQGVIHRDIKPANVIVQPDGHTKIVDFGIARVQGSNPMTELTNTGNVIGTIHYIAPERFRGQPFDGRSDIFSTGVMLYLLLTGVLPFPGEDVTVLHKLVYEPHPPLNTLISGYPPYLDTILERALAKDPNDRYATAEEFAADLRAVSEDLKKGRVTELFNDAEQYVTEQQFVRAQEVLQQLIKIDAQHTGAKQLLGIVRKKMEESNRAEQVRQLVAGADDALASSRFTEALASLDQAIKLDPTNTNVQAKLEAAREKKQRQDDIGNLLAEADASRKRGDLTGALKVLEKALRLDQGNTRLRATYAEFAKQAQAVAQQGKFREMLVNAEQELSSKHFTAAIELLREAGRIDPASAELERLMNAAVTGQQQENRRKLIEQVHAQVETFLVTDEFDRATEMLNRAIEQLPGEASLLQLKVRVDRETRAFKAKQLIDTTVVKAQEAFAASPHEALLIVQRALQELPGEERLLALEDSLRQRLRNLEAEEVRGRYLREAQEAIDRKEFDKAIGILEAYRVEFADSTGVTELLDFAKTELAQQQRQQQIASCAAQAKSLMQEDRITEAIRMLEPVSAETGDASLSRLLTEARSQQAEAARRLEALLGRVKGLRERGQLDEAITVLESSPAANAKGTLLNAMLTELRSENTRKHAIVAAIGTASQALEQMDFQAGMEALQSVRRAYGDTADLSRVISDYEARRLALANEGVGKSLEAARAALLANDPAAALKELQASAALVEFADPAQQADWRRLKTEAGKPPTRRTTGTIDAGMLEPAVEEIPQAAQKGVGPPTKMIALIAGGGAFLLALVIVIWWFMRPTEILITQSQAGATVTIDNLQQGKIDSSGSFTLHVNPGEHNVSVTLDGYKPVEKGFILKRGDTFTLQAPLTLIPTGTLLLQGNVEGANVLVDGAAKGVIANGKASLKLEEGSHSVRITKDGFEDSPESPVTVAANKQAMLPAFNLKAISAKDAYLTIQSIPGKAKVSINNVPKGTTDARGHLQLKVDPGTLEIKVEAKDFNLKTQPIVVQAGDKKTVDIVLEKAPPPLEATLEVHSTPGATVIINNASQGKTDAQGSRTIQVKPGRISLQATLEGYQTFTQTVDVAAGQTLPITALLAPNAKPPVTAPLPPQVVSFTANPSEITEGDSTVLSWETANASEASIDHGIDQVSLNGHTPPISPKITTTYTLIAKGPGGSQQKPVTVVVNKKPELKSNSNPEPPVEVSRKDESALLREVVDRYRSAYNEHDVEKVRAAWPTLPSGTAKNMQNSFKDPAVKLTIDCSSSPNISEDNAEWACRQTTNYTSSGKVVTSPPNKVTFSFAKKNGNWVISTLK
jgi:eukaryotic-like serine/threonine-protein kinase